MFTFSSAVASMASVSSKIFCTACLCSASTRFLSSSSARLTRACDSNFAMATFWCNILNLSKVTGSSTTRIFSNTSSVTSKLCAALPNATTSSLESVPSWSRSCFSKRDRRSCSCASAAAFRSARSRTCSALSAMWSKLLREASNRLLMSVHSMTELRFARFSVSSLCFSLIQTKALSRPGRAASTATTAAVAEPFMASGAASAENCERSLAASAASATDSSAALNRSAACFMRTSTRSASSRFLFSSSSRFRSSSSRCRISSSIRRCAWRKVCSASSATFWACVPIALTFILRHSSISPRRAS
mmetsp:Transcript_41911/g.119851  ORF Transcript_41911/g.119851 Transcript_41911/m.119851 type:complete len:304 (-) Transcript_41911:639-1550(-)